MNNIYLEKGWKSLLKEEFEKVYFTEIVNFLRKEMNNGKEIYPSGHLIFNAFNTTPLDKVKIIILGQDPYHNPDQAMGLSFSVPKGIKIPASLRTVFKELNTDLDIPIPEHGDLTVWATQGVLLLNSMLTVEKNSPGAHKKIGWQKFTDTVIKKLSDEKENLVFLLWGGFAKKKSHLIDEEKHLILEAAHPSPLARGAYYGSKHFSKANEYLVMNGQKEIDWEL